MKEFIERLTVKNYGCVKDVSVELTPLHAFIGPNDSGKSTLLRAMRTLVQLAGDTFTQNNRYVWSPFDPGLYPLKENLALELVWGDLVYGTTTSRTDEWWHLGDMVRSSAWTEKRGRARQYKYDRQVGFENPPIADALEAKLLRDYFAHGARLLRLDPDALRMPSQLISSREKARLQDERGLGLPAIYDVIVNQNVEAFLSIKKRIRELFPSVQSIGLDNVSESTKAIQIQLLSGEWVPAQFMSEGLLYYLAFAAIPYLDPAAVILVEEPENGLHPARIAEVMRILREVSKTTQVLLATHSPLVINEMKPEEVSIVTRPPEKGTQVTRIDKTPDFEDRAKVYALGELWLSYADGEYESPLLDGGPRP
jgi:energy-coupling factor transporter ATP-binding protein EcfA2